MIQRRLIYAWMIAAIVLSSSLRHAHAVEPFAEALAMRVFDPAQAQRSLERVVAFDQILIPGTGGRVFISFQMAADGPGILVLDSTSLAILHVHRAADLGLDPHDRWRAGTCIPDTGEVLLCASSQEGQNPSLRWIRLSADGPSETEVTPLLLPELPTALTPILGSPQLLALTRPSNFAIRIDARHLQILSVNRDIFPFIPYAYPPGPFLITLANGQIYGSYKGRLFVYLPPDPKSHPSSDTSNTTDDGFFAYLGLLPCEYGHLSQVTLSAGAWDGKKTFVGGTAAGGYLLTVDTDTHTVKPWGKPTDGTAIQSLIHCSTTGFWGLSQSPEQTTRLFHFRPAEGVLKDHGVPSGTLEENGRRSTWRAHQLADMAMMPDGRILLAEKANQAKLLLFDPRDAPIHP